jgi:hypothetical protein
MNTTWITLGAVAIALAVFAVLSLRLYFQFRGARVIRCPENLKLAVVEVNAGRLALSGLLGPRNLRLQNCTRWPEKAGCGQECLAQIASAHDGCLVRSMLADWYIGKTCVLCGRAFEKIDWLDSKPGLLNPEGKTVEWGDISPEKVPEALFTHQPVCWNCHTTETFRRLHPELVTDREWRGASRHTGV